MKVWVVEGFLGSPGRAGDLGQRWQVKVEAAAKAACCRRAATHQRAHEEQCRVGLHSSA